MGEQLIPDSAVKAIQDSVHTETIAVPEGHFVTREVFTPPEHLPTKLSAHTLCAVVDFLKANIDKLDLSTLAIHVAEYNEVLVLGAIEGRLKRRPTLLVAEYESVLGKFNFGQFYDSETFNISLQSLFRAGQHRDDVLRIVGTLKDEKVVTAEDDGMTQIVTARAGVARVAEVAIPNPVTLYPYRTFREVDQPSSLFILRMQRGKEGELPRIALFEADGGLWKLDAIRQIKDWLEAELAKANLEVPIIA